MQHPIRGPLRLSLILSLVGGLADLVGQERRVGDDAPGAQAPDEFADLVTQERRVGDDAHRRYFLIARREAQPPADGFKLLLVLPGGDGGAGFLDFVRRVHLEALGPDYLVAQVVAPVWSPDQGESLVWPLEKNPWPGMELSTEELLNDVVADVASERAVDPAFVFTLGWSSGGPAAYAYSVAEGSRATGTFVAMSVFKPGQMRSLKGAKGHAYFLLHSPDDFIPMDFPQQAEKQLSKAKAEVELVTYEGGHGWQGDVYGNLRRGIAFLEAHHGKPRKAKSSRRH